MLHGFLLPIAEQLFMLQPFSLHSRSIPEPSFIMTSLNYYYANSTNTFLFVTQVSIKKNLSSLAFSDLCNTETT